MAEENGSVIKKQPVHGRDESGARLFGWTNEEILTVGGVGIFAIFFIPFNYLKLATIILAWIWVKRLRAHFPERYLTNIWKFYTRSDYYLRASQKDIEWRPPTD